MNTSLIPFFGIGLIGLLSVAWYGAVLYLLWRIVKALERRPLN